jgi:hypothetical protein
MKPRLRRLGGRRPDGFRVREITTKGTLRFRLINATRFKSRSFTPLSQSSSSPQRGQRSSASRSSVLGSPALPTSYGSTTSRKIAGSVHGQRLAYIGHVEDDERISATFRSRQRFNLDLVDGSVRLLRLRHLGHRSQRYRTNYAETSDYAELSAH